MKPNPDAAPAAPRKPRLALAIATGFGVGYVPKVSGTLGSIVGVVLALGLAELELGNLGIVVIDWIYPAGQRAALLAALVVYFLGVWSAGRAATHAGIKDPQYVVIDEVSGQHLTYLLGGGLHAILNGLHAILNWKSALLGFILFRVFDIWKPFPVRQAEKLPGGWGIMADDWVAAIYAALGLWVARYLGL